MTPPAGKDKDGVKRRWPVHVPLGLGNKALGALTGKVANLSGMAPVTVRVGDTLETVAARYRVSETELKRVNQVGPGDGVSAGDVLFVPGQGDGPAPAEDVEDFVAVPRQEFFHAGRNRVFYRVRSDDTVASLAYAFGVNPDELRSWNGLDERAHLQADMTLVCYVPKGVDLSRVRYILPQNTEILETGSPEFITFFESQKGRTREVVAALPGDTLQKIGARYGMSLGMMERINRRHRSSKLSPGDPVVVYTKRPVPERELAGSLASALPPVLSPVDEQASVDAPKAKAEQVQ